MDEKILREKELLSSSEFRKKLFERINSISSVFNVNYPINPKIRYEYPEINETTIENIVNALISYPKFYVQTLHLMNKMNLPCPLVSFIRTARQPLLKEKANPIEISNEKINTDGSSSESEIEIETDKEIPTTKRVLNDQIKNSKPKRLKIQEFIKQPNESEESKSKVCINEIFESEIVYKEKHQPKILKQTTYDRQVVQIEGDGFAKIIPIDKKPSDVLFNEQSEKEETSNENLSFITLNELEKNRLKLSELKNLPVFKNYEKGEISSRLYVKNLAKNAQESDLKFIYGRYIDWTNEAIVNSFDIRLMKEGRMKGQAFITFASEDSALKALNETNGYMLYEKPLVVSFARSAKPK